MTTTLMPPDPAATTERALRILPIAANLLPAEIVALRRGRKVRRAVLAALSVFAVLLGGWYGLARHQTSVANSELSAAEDAGQSVLRQQRAFADVVSTQTESKAISTQLASLMAHDLRWSRLLSSVYTAMPRGVQVATVSGALTAPAAGTAAVADAGKTATGMPDPAGHKLVGTLTVNGTGPSQLAVADYLDALAKTLGLANVMLNGVAAQDDGLQFTIQLDVTSSALGGRFAATTIDGPGER
jgi:Tfp pilus assembly protein PilN